MKRGEKVIGIINTADHLKAECEPILGMIDSLRLGSDATSEECEEVKKILGNMRANLKKAMEYLDYTRMDCLNMFKHLD